MLPFFFSMGLLHLQFSLVLSSVLFEGLSERLFVPVVLKNHNGRLEVIDEKGMCEESIDKQPFIAQYLIKRWIEKMVGCSKGVVQVKKTLWEDK